MIQGEARTRPGRMVRVAHRRHCRGQCSWRDPRDREGSRRTREVFVDGEDRVELRRVTHHDGPTVATHLGATVGEVSGRDRGAVGATGGDHGARGEEDRARADGGKVSSAPDHHATSPRQHDAQRGESRHQEDARRRRGSRHRATASGRATPAPAGRGRTAAHTVRRARPVVAAHVGAPAGAVRTAAVRPRAVERRGPRTAGVRPRCRTGRRSAARSVSRARPVIAADVGTPAVASWAAPVRVGAVERRRARTHRLRACSAARPVS